MWHAEGSCYTSPFPFSPCSSFLSLPLFSSSLSPSLPFLLQDAEETLSSSSHEGFVAREHYVTSLPPRPWASLGRHGGGKVLSPPFSSYLPFFPSPTFVTFCSLTPSPLHVHVKMYVHVHIHVIVFPHPSGIYHLTPGLCYQMVTRGGLVKGTLTQPQYMAIIQAIIPLVSKPQAQATHIPHGIVSAQTPHSFT